MPTSTARKSPSSLSFSAVTSFSPNVILPQDAASRPVEAFWIFRAVDALESLAHKDPSIPNVESAVSALRWLEQTGTADQSSVRQRIRALRKKQYQPALPASSNTTTTPESSKS